MLRARRLALATLAAAGLAACGGGSSSPARSDGNGRYVLTLTAPAVVDADGVSTGLVTATVRDASANPVFAASVTFTAPGATLSATTATTDAAGQASVTARSATGGIVTITASSGGASQHVDVQFVEPAALWVTGYYVGYQRGLYPPDQVDFSAMTHLAVGAVLPGGDGSLDTGFYVGPSAGPELASTLAARAHAAGRKALLMVGGAGYGDAFRSAAFYHLDAFAANLLAVNAALHFDGFDLDWEPLEPSDVTTLVALANRLRAGAPGITLTLPVGWVNVNSGADAWVEQLATTFDQLNIMSYGMADGPANGWTGWVTWHSAALAGEDGNHPSSVSSSANAYAALGIPKRKIGIGLGFYGSCWRGPTAPLQPAGSGVVASDNAMSYANIMAGYWSAAAYHWDATASMGYLSFAAETGPERCTFVSYEDATSIQAKGDWVRANGYGGAIVWTVNQGATGGGANPPLDAVKAAFRP